MKDHGVISEEMVLPHHPEVHGVARAEEGLHISPAGIQDLGEIFRIEQASFTAPWSEAMIKAECFDNPFANFFVCRWAQGEAILGYLCDWVVFEELRLMNLAVDSSARKHGIAKRLVQHALARGRERGATRCVLEVRASNDAALRLYGQFGFRQFGTRRGYYSKPNEDAMLMQLELGSKVATAVTVIV